MLWITIFFLAAFASDQQSSCSSEEIVVATYNILYRNCGGYFDGCQCSNSSPARYAANEVRPDILGTQENGCQVDFGNDMGSDYEVVPYDCQSCNHNAIYYNTATIQYGGQRGVENTVHRDAYSLRMYSWSRMLTNNGFAFWVFNVHNPHEHGNYRGFQGRIAEQMINKWKEVSNGEPAVFTGDFNPHKDSNRWEEYAIQHGLIKAGQSSGGVCGFCDQIYYSSGDFEVVSTTVHGSGGSDHNAYSVVLRTTCSGNGGGNVQPPVVNPDPVDPATCDIVPQQCQAHIDWATQTGKNTNPDYYPDFSQTTGVSLDVSTAKDMTLYFYCSGTQADDCTGLLPPCCGGEPCSCDVSTPPVNPTDGVTKKVVFLGKDTCTSSSPCQDAQSDCDDNSQCAGDLICWQRDNGETKDGYDVSDIQANADVCIQPENGSDGSQNDEEDPSEPVAPATCGDNASESCQRHIDWAIQSGQNSNPEWYPDFTQTTGAVIGEASAKDMALYFFCKGEHQEECTGMLPPCCGAQPCSCDGSTTTPSEPTEGPKRVAYLGPDACTSSSPCEDAESDCDTDADCAGDLICWQRDIGETRDGYDTSDIRADADVCVQPDGGSSGNPTTPGTNPVTPNAPTGLIDSMSDEFTGPYVDTSKWEIKHYDASWKNQEKQCYVPSNVKVENGNLILTATGREYFDWRCGVQQYFSGSTEFKNYFLHGSIEVRARLPSGDGLWPAIWLLGNTGEKPWPACGEIDMMEVANKDPTGSISTLHYGERRGSSINLHFGNTPKIPLKTDFHTWKIIRTSEMLVMLFDGVEYGRKSRQEILATGWANAATMFDAPMRLILNVAVGGQFTGIGNKRPNMATWDKATLEVDYVRTTDDETIPPQPAKPCLEHMACSDGQCYTCIERISWLQSNEGKTYDQAKEQVAQEFPEACNCPNVQAAQALELLHDDNSDQNGSSSFPSWAMYATIGLVALGVITMIACVWNRHFKNAPLEDVDFGEPKENASDNGVKDHVVPVFEYNM